MMNVFEKKSELVMQYLRNITAKLTVVLDRVDALQKRVEGLGTACQSAFGQTKVVVSALAREQADVRMDLAEYGGTIEASTFF